jgi:hypothetical protein
MKNKFILVFVFFLLILSIGFCSASWFGDFWGKMTGKVIAPQTNITIIGNYSGFYDFPQSFFDNSNLTPAEVVKATDAQYLALRYMHNGIKPYDFERIEYQEDVYGMTMPNGLKLGKYASPSMNNGHHSWDVMAHEQGHNFFGGTSGFYSQLATPYPFLQESLAVLSASYSYNYIKNNSLGLSPNTLADMNFVFTDEDKYQKSMYEQYIANGKRFNISDVLTSQALDWQMITYGNLYGWNNYKKLAKMFEDNIAGNFTFYKDGASDIEQSTYIIAILGVSFNKDFRSDFKNLSFPVNETLYSQISLILKPIINTNMNNTNTTTKYTLTCQNLSQYTTSWTRNACSASDCGKDKYVGCDKKGVFFKYYQEICQKTNIILTECSEKPVCKAGWKEVSRVNC